MDFLKGKVAIITGATSGLVGGRNWSVQQASFAGMKQAFGIDA